MTLVCQSRDWNFLFYFFNLIDTIRETVDNGDYLNRNLSSYCLERVNWYHPENEKFSLKMVFINFEKEENFFLIMNILIWRESFGKHALETHLYFLSQPDHIKML